jgi:hypothetical protein
MPVIPALRRQKQEAGKFEASPSYNSKRLSQKNFQKLLRAEGRKGGDYERWSLNQWP